MKHYPLTLEQRQMMKQDVTDIMEKLTSITNLLRASQGDQDPSVLRGEEAFGASQRLAWALERQTQTADAVPPIGDAAP